MDPPSLILINPWIYDFAAYDLWPKPLFHNNTLLPCWDQAQRGKVPELKRLATQARDQS